MTFRAKLNLSLKQVVSYYDHFFIAFLRQNAIRLTRFHSELTDAGIEKIDVELFEESKKFKEDDFEETEKTKAKSKEWSRLVPVMIPWDLSMRTPMIRGK